MDRRPHCGDVVRYVGDEHPSLRGRDLQVVQVQKVDRWVRLHSAGEPALREQGCWSWPGPNVPWRDISAVSTSTLVLGPDDAIPEAW